MKREKPKNQPETTPLEWEKWARYLINSGWGMGSETPILRVAMALEIAYKCGIEVGAGRYPPKPKKRRKPKSP